MKHVTTWECVLRYAPILNQRMHRKLRYPNDRGGWMTYDRIADGAVSSGAVDSTGGDRFRAPPNRDLIAAKLFLRLALSGAGTEHEATHMIRKGQIRGWERDIAAAAAIHAACSRITA